MATQLTRFTVKTEEEILRLHELCMQLGSWAGLPVPERIRFAAEIATHSYPRHSGVIQVCFSIEEKKGQTSLVTEIQNHSRKTQKRFLQPLDPSKLPPVTEIVADTREKTGQDYKDMQQFTFALAHDLKNSLTKLKLALSLMEDEEMPPAINNYFQIINRSAERLETIMIGLNKIIQLGDTSPDVVKPVSPVSVFGEVQEEFSEVLQQAGAEIKTDFSELPQLNYIEVYLKSIFTNLVSNAIKYSSAHRPLRLCVSARRQNGRAAFSFADNGQGIDLKKVNDKLFQPFTRFSNSSEGSGIGLYLVKNIVERNGGQIIVESEPDNGTTFQIILQEYNLPS
jgi:two-component system CheB/CheR fusion protein